MAICQYRSVRHLLPDSQEQTFQAHNGVVMQLREFRVEKYRNILDSSPIAVEKDVTCLVGKNESGKTNLLEALYRLNPVSGEKFQLAEQYPRWRLNADRKSGETDQAIPVAATFELEESDREAIENLTGPGVLVEDTATFMRDYDDQLHVECGINETQAVANVLGTLTLHDVTRVAMQNTPDLPTLRRAVGDERTRLQPEPEDSNITRTTPDELNAIDAAIGRVLDRHATLEAAIAAALADRLPKFFHFSNYNILPGRVDLAELVSPAEEPAKSAHQTARALLQLAGTDIASLTQQDYEIQTAELEAVSNTLTQQVFEYWTQSTDLRVQIRVEDSIQQVAPHPIVVHFLNVRVEDQRHGFSNNFGQRSSGFQWFFSFLAAFTEFERLSEPVIVLLDEPGLSLHAKAQADFLRFITERLAPVGPVIYTTHSPFMVEMGHLERVRIVEDKGPAEGAVVSQDVLSTDRDSIFPLQAALGYDIVQSLFVGPDNLVIEGTSDYAYLSVLSDFLRAQGRGSLDPRWRLLPVGGIANVPAFVALIGPHLDVTVLVDAGASRMQRLTDMVAKGLLVGQRLITVADVVGAKNADIEDLFSEGDYLKLYNPAFHTQHTVRDLPPGDRIVMRLSQLDGDFEHGTPADYLLRHRDTLCPGFSQTTFDRFEALFERINQTLA
jgi:predicted ATPase